jgi:hypothetical protein
MQRRGDEMEVASRSIQVSAKANTYHVRRRECFLTKFDASPTATNEYWRMKRFSVLAAVAAHQIP